MLSSLIRDLLMGKKVVEERIASWFFLDGWTVNLNVLGRGFNGFQPYDIRSHTATSLPAPSHFHCLLHAFGHGYCQAMTLAFVKTEMWHRSITTGQKQSLAAGRMKRRNDSQEKGALQPWVWTRHKTQTALSSRCHQTTVTDSTIRQSNHSWSSDITVALREAKLKTNLGLLTSRKPKQLPLWIMSA